MLWFRNVLKLLHGGVLRNEGEEEEEVDG